MLPPKDRLSAWTVFTGPKPVRAAFDVAGVSPDYNGPLPNRAVLNLQYACGQLISDGYEPCDGEFGDALAWILHYEMSRDPDLGTRPNGEAFFIPRFGWFIDTRAGRAFPKSEVILRYLDERGRRKLRVRSPFLGEGEIHLADHLGLHRPPYGVPLKNWSGPGLIYVQ